jgi:hypothetical protein
MNAIGESVLYSVKISIWLVYLASPEPARATVAAAFSPKPFLERWNQGLRERVRVTQQQEQHAYLSSLESIVQHVMEEKR